VTGRAIAAVVIVIAGWILWLAPFVGAARRMHPAANVDRRARIGIALQAVAYALLWQGHFWLFSPPIWHFAMACVALGCGIVLAWTAARALGKEFRFDAAVGEDHALVRSGPYAILRHPIYASMACVLLGTGTLVAPWFLFAPAILVFVAGTEIRVRVEDHVLLNAFGNDFIVYRRRTRAYVPGVR
jgi:protein-S-isoprenylcysteine O-methyltransferase Ste14